MLRKRLKFIFILFVFCLIGTGVFLAPLEIYDFFSGYFLKENQLQAQEQKGVEKLEIKKVNSTTYAFETLDGNIIEIGTKEHSPPIPYVKLNKWDGEASVSLSFPTDAQENLQLEGNKVKWVEDKLEAHIYPLEPEKITEKDEKGKEHTSTINENGGLEFEIILKEKPESNVLTFNIETEGLKFYYQPELTQEEKDRGAFRPENVVGSYAVYHESKSGDYTALGGKNYKAGKAFHIYRPKMIDSAGNWVWGILNIDKEAGILSVEIPQKFLDGAVYPIRHAAGLTFGYTSIGASEPTMGDYHGGKFMGAAGTATKVSIALVSGEFDYSAYGGLYDNSKNFVVKAGPVVIPGGYVPTAFYDFDIVDTAITAQNYYITGAAYYSWPLNNGMRYDDLGVTNDYVESGDPASWPNPISWIGDPAPYNATLSIYCTYTAAPSNTAPTNGAGSITDMDDTDNLYAQRKWYTGSSVCSDADGFADIDYCEFRLKQGATTRAIFRYDEDTNTFSVESGSTEWDLDTGGSSATELGNDITITWKFKPQWDATQEDDLEIELYVVDDQPESDTDTAQSNYVDVITDLVTTFSIDDDRGNVSQSITASGTVTYSGSSLYPPDAEFTSVSVYDSANNNEGTDTTIVNGAWSVTFNAPATVGIDTYNLYINMADADYTDGEETPSDTFITDQVVFLTGTTLEVTDGRVNADGSTNGEWYAELKYEYDDTEVTDGSVSLNTGSMTWDAGRGRWEYTYSKGSVGTEIRNIASVSGNTHGITTLNSAVTSDSETITFDRIKILTLSAVDGTIYVGTEGTWYAAAELEYDNHPLGSGDSFTLSGYSFSWNAPNNRFEAKVTKNTPQIVTINAFDSGFEATYGITAGNISGLSQSIEIGFWQGGGFFIGPPVSTTTISTTTKEMTREEILTKMIEILKKLIQLYTQLLQLLKS